ncbi:DNA replication factor Cdt1-like [Elysia marginata]|uniref:DNA replication factor Cdt1-like n=1 Tax=Elysia marginata TaxID=1093978 RepID=A0AAV4GZI0_9GAST|nr:DNA replication factor Cdt1-like [Elysia marginata]
MAMRESQEAEKEPEGQTGKNFLIRLVSEVESPDLPVSPLAMTPERSSDSDSTTSEPQDKAPSLESCSPKLKNLSQKLKGLSKMNGKALKNRLKQNGKLEDVKQKLDSLQKALDKTEGAKAAKDEVDGEIILDKDTSKDEEIVPAYQRFEHLAKKGVPSLTLPFSYKALEGQFQAMDSVVSMLHNRSEMCTYSKLKAAVQNFTKKNFEEKTVGQIKTVAPDAYIFRQEKNVCTKDSKKGYTLTVEADLSKEVPASPEEKVSRTPEGKPVFTASALINRKKHFHNSLLGLVMKYHKTFLASLSPPLNIPDSKITRWHPKFQLDKVPDINPSPLPQPPEVLVYHSAKDVLNAQRGRLNPRVEEALAKVAEENKKVAASAVPPASKVTSESQVSSSASSPSMKGIPPALLAKIRAKEALKMEAALTRDPAEDNKTKMMSHLPEMIRIIRSYFITEKKPALPLEAIYKKLEDSYRSGISRKDVEQHVKLMTELVPELVSVVEITRGAFLKLDRNVDTQIVSNKIMNIIKSRK